MSIVIASNNLKKSQELQLILAQENIATVLQSQFNVPAIAETGLTFVENAILKARNACEHTKMAALGDDSGLEVDALDYRPGIYSARFAGEDASDNANVEKLLYELKDVPDAMCSACFQCVIVFLRSASDPTPIICQGTWKGKITKTRTGKNGFGYDPVFWVAEHNCTAAQLSYEIKNTISHRAKAIQKLITLIKQDPTL